MKNDQTSTFQALAAKAKPIHGAPQPKNVPSDMQDTPPVPCEFKPGDRVTYTNDYGVSVTGKTVRGFSKEVQTWGGFVYLDLDCWWFPVKPSGLKIEKKGGQA